MSIPLFKVRMNPYAGEYVTGVLQSGFIGQGPKVEDFETLLQQELQSEQRPLTMNSCTSALDLALHLCGVIPAEIDYDYQLEVISTPMTCFASQIGMIHRDATIRWADVDPQTGLIDPVSVGKLVNKNTAAIMAVDWAGRACDYDELRKFGIPIIEDAAHCWDTRYKGNHIATAGGDYVCWSTQAIKFLTTGDGGILVTPPDKYREAKLLRWYGLDREAGASFRCTQNIQQAGFKYHMNDIAAQIGICNMTFAADSVKKHRANAKRYCEELDDCQSISFPAYDPDCSYWLFSLLVEKGTKEEFQSYLANNGISSSPVHHRNDLYDCVSQFKVDLPGLDNFASKQLAIPVGWWVSEEEMTHIIDVIKRY